MFYSVRGHKQPGLETWPKKNELFSFPAEFRENTVVSGQSFQAGENSQTKKGPGGKDKTQARQGDKSQGWVCRETCWDSGSWKLHVAVSKTKVCPNQEETAAGNQRVWAGCKRTGWACPGKQREENTRHVPGELGSTHVQNVDNGACSNARGDCVRKFQGRKWWRLSLDSAVHRKLQQERKKLRIKVLRLQVPFNRGWGRRGTVLPVWVRLSKGYGT